MKKKVEYNEPNLRVEKKSIKRCCKNCDYWEERLSYDNMLYRMCRLKPPIGEYTEIIDEKVLRGTWVETQPSDWCGEFKPKTKEKK